jgi:hypothetical protein
MIRKDIFIHMDKLPEHKKLCAKVLSFFENQADILGAFVSGSGVSGGMDFYSDLDLGFLCSSEKTRERIWSQRWDWKIAPWFHRMDADHIKPHFIIYLFEPHIHVDLSFYTPETLPTSAGAPYSIAFDKKNYLSEWFTDVNNIEKLPVDWSNVVHEEERFWTWTHYSWCHSGRGEYYDEASTFGIMRGILEKWHARLEGAENFVSRRLEQKGEGEFIQRMRACFPTPDRASMKAALLNMVSIHNEQRAKVEKLIWKNTEPKWTTTQAAREKITQLVKEI